MTPLKAKCSICGKEESNQDLKNLCESDDNLISEIESSTGIGNIEIWM